MFKKVCFIIGCLSAANAQNPFCSEDLCFIRPDPKSGAKWMDAQQICKNNNSTLPIVDNANSQRSFVAALSYYGLNGMDVWLGANASDNGSDNWHWLDGSQYTPAAEVQQRGEYYKSYAFVANRTNQVIAYASPPNASYSYICQCNGIDPGTCTTGSGGTTFVRDNRCYMKYDEKLPWFSARDKCLASSCDLASFSQLSLLNEIVDSSEVWVGLRTSQWNWQNAVTGLSSDVTFTSWRIGQQPNDASPTCIATDSGDFPNWKDADCVAYIYPHICQVSDVRSSSVSSATPSTTTTSLQRTPGTARTSTDVHVNELLSSLPKMSTTKWSEFASTGNNTISTGRGSVNEALAIGLGVGLGVPFIILIVVIIVVVVVVLRRKHRNGAESRNAQSTKKFVANDSEVSTDDRITGAKGKKKKDTAGVDDSPVQYATVRETNPTPDLVPPSTQGTVYADLRFSGEGS